MAPQERRRLLDPEMTYTPEMSDIEHHEHHAYAEKPIGCLQALVEFPLFQSLVGAIILANAVVIGLETDEKEEDWLFPMLEDVFLCLFAFELSIRLCAYGLRGFFNPYTSDFCWNLFDFTLVLFGVIDRGLCWLQRLATGPQLYIVLMRVFRLLRILRIFRIFRVMRELHIIASGLIDAVQSVFWVSVICALILYVCGVTLTRLVGHPEEGDTLALVKKEYFGSLSSSMLTLFELMAFPNMERFQPVFSESPSLKIFFVIFVIFGAFMMASILTGVITEGMMEKSRLRQEEKRFERETARAAFVRSARMILQEHSGTDSAFIDKSQFEKCKSKVLSVCETDCMHLREKDLDAIFDLVDYEDSYIVEIEELLYGMVQVSAELRPMSILELKRSFARGLNAVSQQVSTLDTRLQLMDARLQQVLAKPKPDANVGH